MQKLIAGRGGSKAFPCSCGGATGVNDSRSSGDGIRRRRICLTCGKRFTTYEVQAKLSTGVLEKAESVAKRAEAILAVSGALLAEIEGLRKIINAHRTLEAARYGNAGPQ